MAKLTLEIDNIKTTYEIEDNVPSFDDLLHGFLGCMFAHGFVPGTEMNCFADYLYGMKDLYKVDPEIFDGLIKEKI